MSNIFFDFDGTLVNSQKRLYNLFCTLCPQNSLSYIQYWELKRGRMLQQTMLKEIFNYSDEEINNFHEQYLSLIETYPLMSMDNPVDGATELLKSLSSNHNLYLVTNRQKKFLVYEQLNDFGWLDLFKTVFVTERKNTKYDILKKLDNVSSNDYLISDTGEDIKTAQLMGINSIAVTWGVLNEEILKTYNPNYIARFVNDIKKIITE